MNYPHFFSYANHGSDKVPDSKDRIIENLLAQLASATELLRYYHDEIHLPEVNEAVAQFLAGQPKSAATEEGKL